MKKLSSENEPSDPKLWEQVQALTKGEKASITVDGEKHIGPNDGKGFKIFPSAYANGWAAKKYKELGGKWRKKKESSINLTKIAMLWLQSKKPDRDKGSDHGGLDSWFQGSDPGEKDAPYGDWVAITPVEKTIEREDGTKKVYKPGDIVGPCGISSEPEWKDITNNGKDPLKCMPRPKAHDMPKDERADLAKNKMKKEKEDGNNKKKPTLTPTFKKRKEE